MRQFAVFDLFQFSTVDLIQTAEAELLLPVALVLFPLAAPGIEPAVMRPQLRSSPFPCSRAHSTKSEPLDAIAPCRGIRRNTTAATNTEKTFMKRMSDSLACDVRSCTKR